jgi:hypothetical protein
VAREPAAPPVPSTGDVPPDAVDSGLLLGTWSVPAEQADKIPDVSSTALSSVRPRRLEHFRWFILVLPPHRTSGDEGNITTNKRIATVASKTRSRQRILPRCQTATCYGCPKAAHDSWTSMTFPAFDEHHRLVSGQNCERNFHVSAGTQVGFTFGGDGV